MDGWMGGWVNEWIPVVVDLASIKNCNLLASTCPLSDSPLASIHTPSFLLPCFNLGLSSDAHTTLYTRKECIDHASSRSLVRGNDRSMVNEYNGLLF